jgi:prevent-host-death family protein
MTTFTFTDFRKNASAILDRVEGGESICVMRHGKAIARIIPAKRDQPEPAWKRPGPRLVIPGASLSAVLLEERRSAR